MKKWGGGLQILTPSLGLEFSGGYFGVYLVTGYVIKKMYRKMDGKKSIVAAIIFFISLVLTFAVQYHEIRNNQYYDVWYNTASLYICGVTLFLLMTYLFRNVNNKVIKLISQNSLGIYFLHAMILEIINKNISFSSHVGKLIAAIILSVSISMVISMILALNRYTARVFINNK